MSTRENIRLIARTPLMLLVILDLKKEVGNISLIIFCHIKQLTHISKSSHFNALNSS